MPPRSRWRRRDHGSDRALADQGFGGIVGSEILRRFTATADYPRPRLLLEPNAHFDEPLEELRKSLRTEPDVEHTFEVERDRRRFTASFRLRRMI